MRVALFAFSALQSGALVLLLASDNLGMVYLFAILFGASCGGPTALTTSIRGVYFGRKAFASITGMSMIPMNLFLLAAPLFAGIMFDITGSYNIPFGCIAVISFVGATLFLLLGNPRHPDKFSN